MCWVCLAWFMLVIKVLCVCCMIHVCNESVVSCMIHVCLWKSCVCLAWFMFILWTPSSSSSSTVHIISQIDLNVLAQKCITLIKHWGCGLAQLSVGKPASYICYLDQTWNGNLTFQSTKNMSPVSLASRPQFCVSDSRWCTAECESCSALLWSWAEHCLHPSWDGRV